ncbi:hypothetical protein STCU_01751 [Strigomonas culicis]|nr:hypothetical protein STCU_01751 [Strigomonas culicis]|eukprot:EPY34220.1 hypothetical protein STCU_01751 [Strigomonas culicis]
MFSDTRAHPIQCIPPTKTTTPPTLDFLTTYKKSRAPEPHPAAEGDLGNSFAVPHRGAALPADDAAGRVVESLRDTLTKSASLETIFSCAAPEGNEFFSVSTFTKRISAFLLPFLALPHMPFSPCRITSLPQEREYVVSGATLRHDFDPPTYSLYVIFVAMCLQIACIVLVASRVQLGQPQDGAITLAEVVVPCLLWLHLGLFFSSYNSFLRMPHSLERLDRNLTPQLSAFAASVVDARSRVCIYTWDEEGRSKVRNNHYRLRWFLYALLFGAIMSFAAPSTRGGFGHSLFGFSPYEKAASLCSFFSTFFFCSVQSYYILKIIDMEREISEKLSVLTELAFLEQRSIMKPSSDIRQPFEIDLTFNVSDLFRGFPGWFTTRSIVLYASTCANHCARYTSMSVFVVSMIMTFCVVLADLFHMVGRDYLHSGAYFSTAHAYGLFVIFFWGLLLMRYLCTCAKTKREYLRHLYVMDVSSMYHLVKKESREAGEIIDKCRRMANTHDTIPNLFGLPYYPLVVVLFFIWGLAALTALAFQLAQAIHY